MKSNKSTLVTATLLASVLVGAMCAGSASAADPVDAAKLWSKNCQTCHGADGKGKTKSGEKAGVKDLTLPEVKKDLTKAKAVASMKDGIKEKDSDKMAMKSFADKLSAEEIEALADYSLAFK